MDARHRALGNPDLLEGILSFLIVKDLLNAQFTNRFFKDVVSKSNRLQKILFLVGDAAEASDWARCINPISAFLLPRRISGRNMNAPMRTTFPQRHENQNRGNKYIAFLDRQGLSTCLIDVAHIFDTEPETFKIALQTLESLNQSGSSWRQMFVTQPPIRRMRVYRDTRCITGGTVHGAARRTEHVFPPGDGLRLGTLYILAWRWLHDRNRVNILRFRERNTDHNLCQHSIQTNSENVQTGDPGCYDADLRLGLQTRRQFRSKSQNSPNWRKDAVATHAPLWEDAVAQKLLQALEMPEES